MNATNFTLNDSEKSLLLKIARTTVSQYLKKTEYQDIDTKTLPASLLEHCGAFVSYHKNGQLRGCIGRFSATEALYKVVKELAISSAIHDTRFEPIDENELDEIDIEISVLTPMRKINNINEIELGKHGIYIKKGFSSGTFLPQVATSTGWNLEEFLGYCARDKAHIGWKGWQNADIFIYEAIVFGEKHE